jgi:hypothetical protein
MEPKVIQAVGGIILAGLGALGGVLTDYGGQRAGASFSELSASTGRHIATLQDQVDGLEGDKQMLLDRHTAEMDRLRADRDRVRREREALALELARCRG